MKVGSRGGVKREMCFVGEGALGLWGALVSF